MLTTSPPSSTEIQKAWELYLHVSCSFKCLGFSSQDYLLVSSANYVDADNKRYTIAFISELLNIMTEPKRNGMITQIKIAIYNLYLSLITWYKIGRTTTEMIHEWRNGRWDCVTSLLNCIFFLFFFPPEYTISII